MWGPSVGINTTAVMILLGIFRMKFRSSLFVVLIHMVRTNFVSLYEGTALLLGAEDIVINSLLRKVTSRIIVLRYRKSANIHHWLNREYVLHVDLFILRFPKFDSGWIFFGVFIHSYCYMQNKRSSIFCRLHLFGFYFIFHFPVLLNTQNDWGLQTVHLHCLSRLSEFRKLKHYITL